MNSIVETLEVDENGSMNNNNNNGNYFILYISYMLNSELRALYLSTV